MSPELIVVLSAIVAQSVGMGFFGGNIYRWLKEHERRINKLEPDREG